MPLRLSILLFLGFTMCCFPQTIPQKQTERKKTEDHYINILWLDQNNKLRLNEDYLKTLTDPQRAALGYIATDIGNECYWDGDQKEDESNLKCQLIWALNLGYQCSDTHLSFLRKWFKEDQNVLQRLENCKRTVSSSKIQDRFIGIKMATNKQTIKIIYTAAGSDSQSQQEWRWAEESEYSFTANAIKQIHRKNINGSFN
ncbi:hypothetical protein [Flavobacterium sp. FlaQc-48]|uniref:hypothetical protein n=1 Tax=Flavobacterium sp. FlaQc-48 TaxID=3374181 RepID=UPI00375803CD